jgi:hypothetical protein
MFDRLSINPTQLTGLLSFAAATIACSIAAWRSGSRDASTWRLLALINCLFLMETFSGLRYDIHNRVKAMLTAEDLYSQIHGRTQEIINILIAIIALIFATLLLFWRQVAGGAARVAVSITIVVVGLFAIETVSLHELRAVIYQPIGPVVMIGWLWAIAAAGICLAAVGVTRSWRRP